MQTRPYRPSLAATKTFFFLALAYTALTSMRAPAAETLTLVTNAPTFGTFYSLTVFQAPFPFNPFPELPLYALTNGVYAYDDTQIDYVSLKAEAQLSLGLFSEAGGGGGVAMLSSPPPPGGGGGGSGSGGGGFSQMSYGVAGLKLTIPLVLTNGYLYTTIFDHNPSLAYDIYSKTNLNSTNWLYAKWGDVGQTNYYLWQASYPTNGFFLAANGVDSDGDGMPDNWEAGYGLNPHNAADASSDSDSDGMTNLQEFLQGSNPTSAPAFQVTVTTPRGLAP